MMSARYAPAICVLLAFALVPTLIHSYSSTSDDDGRETANIPKQLVGYESTPGQRNENWGMRRFQSDDWVERVYRDDKGDALSLTVVRSLDAKSLYHHPELAIAYHKTSFDAEEIVRSQARSEIPIHVLEPSQGERTAAFYVLHYGDRFIDDPLKFQIQTAGQLLFSRRKPTTLFFLLDEDAPAQIDIERSPAIALLFAAIDAFVRQQPST